jgi:GMP synthase (glutamine-hydrolysing)
MSVNDELDYLRRELGVLEIALATGKPVLGICLGAQLIARALGASVHRNPVKEIGWAPVERTDAGRIDPLLAGFQDPETVLHWHGETFDLPAGATWLAFSKDCAHQAFRYGASVYGLQFHLEATPEMIAEWCATAVNADDIAGLPEPVDPTAHATRMRELSAITFQTWTRLLQDSEAAGAS